jgi:ABC-type Na+ efflux pump permease subunit
MKHAWYIALADLRRNLRHRETLVWVFAMPLVFFYFIGSVTGGFGNSSATKTRLTLSVGENPGFLLEQLEARLTERNFDVRRAESAEAFAAAKLRLAIPANFTQRVQDGETAQLLFGGRSDGLSGDVSSLQVQRAAYTVLADVIAASELSGDLTPESLASLAAQPRALTLDVSNAGDRITIPQGFEQAIPGTLTMFTLIVLLTSGAVGLVIERREGLLRRLAFAPMSRAEIVLGKWLANLGLGMIQVLWGMLIGGLVFGMRWGPNLPMIVVVMFGWAAFAASVGLLSGSLSRTEGQAIGLGVLVSNVLAALGGCWWPIEITPKPMQTLAEFLPTGWTMGALHKLVSFGLPAASALPQVALLFLFALAFGLLAARTFRFD